MMKLWLTGLGQLGEDERPMIPVEALMIQGWPLQDELGDLVKALSYVDARSMFIGGAACSLFFFDCVLLPCRCREDVKPALVSELAGGCSSGTVLTAVLSSLKMR